MDPVPYDVVIVGAGPGGLSCARSLRGSGLRVLVLEKNERVGKKICSGEISGKVLPGERFDRGHPWTEITVGTDDTRQVVKFGRPYLWTVGRYEFESRLLAGCDAEVHFSEPVTKITEAHVETPKGRYSYKHLVGADGSFSSVRSYLGLPTERIAGWAFHYLDERPCPEFQMYWLPRTFPSAYGYMMSKSRGRTMIGLAWRGKDFDHKTAERAKGWIAKTFSIDPSKLRSEAMKGNADHRGWRFGNVYLVGDAGGFLNPLTTEGIYYAVKSGDAVARHIRGDPEGKRILDQMGRTHGWYVLAYDLATDTRLPFRWVISWILSNPHGGVRKRMFDWVFWRFMDQG